MATKKNTLVEASERYRDMKSRGLVPKVKGAWQEFVKEVASDRNNGDFVGRFTAKGYSKDLGITVGYGSGENKTDLKLRYLEAHAGDVDPSRISNSSLEQRMSMSPKEGFDINETDVSAFKNYQDFNARGLIPKRKVGVWQEFVKESESEKSGENFIGRYTAKGYSLNLGLDVKYGTGETKLELRARYLELMLEKYKAELLDLFDLNDFLKLAEKYGKEFGFKINDVMYVQTYSELLRVVNKAQAIEHEGAYMFRNANGRNRQTESSDIEEFYDSFQSDLRAFKNELISFMNRYKIQD